MVKFEAVLIERVKINASISTAGNLPKFYLIKKLFSK